MPFWLKNSLAAILFHSIGTYFQCDYSLVLLGETMAGNGAALLTQLELDAALTLADVLVWANVVGPLRDAFYTCTGSAHGDLPRILGVVTEVEFSAIVRAMQIPVPLVNPGDVQAFVRPTLNQIGSLLSIGYFCRAKTGFLGLPRPAFPPAVPAAGAGGLAIVPAGAPLLPLVAKTKLGHVLRQGDDTELAIVDDTVLATGTARWERLFGIDARPGEDIEVTAAQLTCLKHLADTGQVPYVDFALWGPHGNRLERRLKFSGQQFDADGIMRTIEIYGPGTLTQWIASWEVYSTACIFLNIMDLGTLMAYRTLIVGFHARYGQQCWLLLYQADTRFRLEHLLRTKRLLSAAHDKALLAQGTTSFSPLRPWTSAMSAGILDMAWWAHEFSDAAIMLLARTANVSSFLSGDFPVSPQNAFGGKGNNAGQSIMIAEPQYHNEGSPAKRQKTGRDRNAPDQSVVKEGKYTSNRGGRELCASFQTGACGETVGQGMCPNNREQVHQCSKCLGPHGSIRCPGGTPEPRVRTPFQKGGKQGGKHAKVAKGKGKGNW